MKWKSSFARLKIYCPINANIVSKLPLLDLTYSNNEEN